MTVEILFSIIIAVAFGLTALYVAIARRHKPTWKAGVVLLLACAEAPLAHALGLMSSDLALRLFWYKMIMLAFTITPTAFLHLALGYSGFAHLLTVRRRLLLCIFPALTAGLILTNEIHGMVWNPAETEQIASSMAFLPVAEAHVWYWLFIAYSYFLFGLGCFLLIHLLTRSRSMYDWQASSVVFAAIAALLGCALDIFRLSPFQPFTTSAVGLAAGTIIVALTLAALRRRDIFTVSRGAIIKSISDAIIVVDGDDRIVNLNPAAERMVGKPASQAIGKLLEQVLPELKANWSRVVNGSGEVALHLDNASCKFDLRVSPLQDWRGHLVSQVILLRDITERKRVEEESQKRGDQLESLRQIGLELTAQLNLTAVLQAIGQRAVSLMGGVTGSFYLYRPGLDIIERVVVTGPQTVWSIQTRRRGEGLIGKVWQSGKPMFTNDYRGWSERNKAYDARPPRNVMGVPLNWGDQFLGVATIIAEPSRQFTDADVELMSLFATQASIAIRNAQLYQAAQQEIAERKAIEQSLRQSEERYSLSTRGANDGLWDWDLRNNIFYYSPRWKSMIGYAESEIGTDSDEWFKRIHPEDLTRVKAEVATHLAGASGHFESEHRICHKDGSYCWVRCRGLAVRDAAGTAYRMAGSLSDISARKQAEEQLLHDALHDALTGLPNRALFMDRLGHALERARRSSENRFAVIYLDFDRFKVVNDSLGHMIGDQLLIEGARRIELCVRLVDTVARFGGDEFVVLLEDIEGIREATHIADRIQSELTLPFNLDGHQVSSSASIGIVLNTAEHETPEEILRDADIAMYRAKALGKARYAIFNSQMRDNAFTRLELERDLPDALERGEIKLHYQPILSLSNGKLTGFEALARWQHSKRGLIFPTEFIPIAEESGFIIPLGQWILREACRQMHEWQVQFPATPPLTISANLSAKQFAQPDLISQVTQAVQETGLDARSLKLEITETVLMDDSGSGKALLEQLRSLEIGVEIDDFGTGYSSLSRLERLPIDALKIDRSFMSKLGVGGSGTGIIRTIMSLAHELDMEVIAEGVESAEQLAMLQELGCEYGQGYLFGMPLDNKATRALIAEWFTTEFCGPSNFKTGC